VILRPGSRPGSRPGPPLGRRTEPRTGSAGLFALGAYGALLASAGVAVALGAVPPQAALEPEQAPALAVAPTIAPGPAGQLRQHGAAAGPVPAASQEVVAAGQPKPFRPTGLVLPGGTTAAVEAVGVHADGALVVPENPARVGWWNGGALAGEAFGSVVIAGHVDSRRYGLGALARLKSVRRGEVVTVTAGERSLRYRVVSTTRISQARLAGDVEFFRQDVPPRLVLITCGGAFDPRRHRYQDNLVIMAEPVA